MEYRNAKYINDRGVIDCEINHPVHGWIPYTLDPTDTDMTVNNDDILAVMAVKNDVSAYVPPTDEEIDASLAIEARGQRDGFLYSYVDPIVTNPLRWAELTAEKQQEYIDYRRQLLDITAQVGFPRNIVWPIKPE